MCNDFDCKSYYKGRKELRQKAETEKRMNERDVHLDFGLDSRLRSGNFCFLYIL